MPENNSQTMLNQYLTFKLGDEMFALDVAQVREILDFTTITKVPRSPAFMRGVINVRGSVVPVVDLSAIFDLMPTEKTIDTRIVVMEIVNEDEVMVVGALADAVHNVIDIPPDQIEAAPKVTTQFNSDFIKGIGKQQEDFIIILDINRVFSAEEIADIQPSSTAAGTHNEQEDPQAA